MNGALNFGLIVVFALLPMVGFVPLTDYPYAPYGA